MAVSESYFLTKCLPSFWHISLFSLIICHSDGDLCVGRELWGFLSHFCSVANSVLVWSSLFTQETTRDNQIRRPLFYWKVVLLNMYVHTYIYRGCVYSAKLLSFLPHFHIGEKKVDGLFLPPCTSRLSALKLFFTVHSRLSNVLSVRWC